MRLRKILFPVCLLAGNVVVALAQTDTLALQEVVVTGTRSATDVRHLPMTVSVLGREELTGNHQTSVLPSVSQFVPGMFITGRGVLGYGVSGGAAGGINMRGISGGAGQLLVLIDGHPQYNGVYGHPISDSYQTLMAEKVEVLHGPASVLYGSNAMGGVVNIVTRDMRTDGTHTDLNLGIGSYGTLQTEVANQLRYGRFSSIIAAQYNRTDNHRPRMGFEQYGGYAKLGYAFSDHWKARADVDITHFNASHPGSVASPLYEANQWITRGFVSAALENQYGRTSGAVSVYSNFGRHKIDDGTNDAAKPTARYFRSRDAQTGISWYQSANLFDGNRLTVGIDYQHIYGRAFYTSKETGAVMDTPNKQSGHSHRNEVAAYVDFRQDLLPWLTVDAGIRLDHHSVTGNEWVPQGGVVVRPVESGEIKAMISKGFRNPSMREMYLYPPSNENLEPERLMNYELSWKQRLLGQRLVYGLNIYYLKGDNMIQTMPIDGKPRNVNTGEIENYGVEFMADYHINRHWRVQTNHSYLHMKTPVLAAPRYKGYLGADYRHGSWTLKVGLQQVAGLYTAVGAEEERESFLLFNTTIAYQLCPQVSLWLRGENLLAQKYEINAGFPMPRATVMGGVSIRL